MVAIKLLEGSLIALLSAVDGIDHVVTSRLLRGRLDGPASTTLTPDGVAMSLWHL
ncbi:MAG: hypothetical protein PVJ49_10990 [Acidobacteriota bacterium]